MGDKKILNQAQRQAVEHGEGPLLIIAGAGTGKTTVVTERIKHLVSSGLASPAEILGLTFTEKASKEMEERVDVALPLGYTQMWISTFHGFCDTILRDEALHIGYDPKFRLLTQSETIQLLRKNLFAFDLQYFLPLGNPTKFLDAIIVHFSRLQDENITPKEYMSWVESLQAKQEKYGELEMEKWEELARAYKLYEELKVREGVMDYGDLIVKVLLLFKSRPNILSEFQDKFKYILVDEYQDTNFAQNELVNLLAAKHGNITVVGDDDQSIYKFRGAAISNILQFRKNYPKAKSIVLTQNYRSSQEILDSAYELIQNNNPDRLEVAENIDKKLVSSKKSKSIESDIEFIHVDRVENEAEEVAQRIIKLVTEDKKYTWSDVAILVRANNHAEPFLRAFSRRGIPHQFLGPGKLFRQPEILDLVAYLKVLRNFEDDISLYRVFSFDFFAIPPMDLIKLSNFARKNNLTLFESAQAISELSVSSLSKELIIKVTEFIKTQMVQTKKTSGGQLLYNFLQEFGLLTQILNPSDPQAQKIAGNIARFFDKIKGYEATHIDARIDDLVDWIDLSAELGESPLTADSDWTKVDAVNILTLHSAKGLEFPVVFLVNLVAERFPSRQRRELLPIPDDLVREVLPSGDFHMQEERRLFYVGMTRACEKLFLTAADFYGEGKRAKKLSPFIFESLGEDIASQQSTVNSEQLSLLDYSVEHSSPFTVHDAQVHVDYLSYSQIETFKMCPLHYKLRYILGLPAPASSAQSFGISVHAALKDFYQAVKSGEKPSEKLLIKKLTSNWQQLGYQNKAHAQKALRQAESYLKSYFAKQFNPKVLPVALEQPFVVDISPKEGHSLKIGGKIDRVDILEDGKIEIIDYKTGSNIPTQSEVDKNLQLTLYALAAREVKECPFNKDPKGVVLSLYYFEGDQKISTQRTSQMLEKAKEEVLAIRDQIEKSDFACSRDFFCQNCEYAMFCSID